MGEGKSRRGGAVVGQREEEEEAEAAGPEEEGPSACRGWPVMANRTCAAAAQHDGKRGSKGGQRLLVSVAEPRPRFVLEWER